MRIVSRAELMAMPAGTLFHEWQPCFFGPMQLKGETWEIDFMTTLVPSIDADNSEEECNRQDEMNERGASYPVDLETMGREGLFDDKLRYAVWERADVAALHAKLGAFLGLSAATPAP